MRLEKIIKFSLVSVFCLLVAISPVLGNQMAIPKEFPVCPLTHITDALLASDGSIWVVGEGGIYKLEQKNSYANPWFDAHYYSGYPETENFYAIAEDLQGRIWVGTDNKGVAVFNGEEWKNYTHENTLPGERVFDIAVSPLTGEVAVATSGGVAIYDPRNDAWKDLSRQNGLVSDQVASLCFDEKGTLWVAYACGGVSSGSTKTNDGTWKTVQAPWYWDSKQFVRQPLSAEGNGLPTNLCNAILARRTGNVWVGTTCGLAFRGDSKKWKYARGEDFRQKNKGVYQAKKLRNIPASSTLLLPEDFVTALAPSDDGVWIGMREKGICLWSAEKGVRKILKLPKEKQGWGITSLLAFPDGSLGATSYGGGFFLAHQGLGSWKKPEASLLEPPFSFPSYPQSHTHEQIMGMLAGKNERKPLLPVAFSGEDWTTRGNWCGRYGNTFAILCAANAPYASCIYTSDFVFGKKKQVNSFMHTYEVIYEVTGFMGMHRTPDDSLRSWVHWVTANSNRNVLYCPTDAVRTEAEWDDHGEAYPPTFDGPDVWVKVSVPEGLHQLSLYFYNPNGREKKTARRDYLVEIRQGKATFDNFQGTGIAKEAQYKELEQKIAYLCSLPVQARTRVSQFAGSGVYKNFILQKAGTYWVRVCRNNSFNTILNGVFISKIFLPGEITSQSLKDGLSSDFCKICPLPPDLNKKSLNKQEMEFFKVWESSLAGGISSPAVLVLQRNALLYQYRHLTSQQPSSTLAPLLKWNLHLWSHEDHRQFDELMTASWNRKQETMPDFRSREFMPHGPGTIPFSIREVRQMEDLGIDWKQYRDSSGSHPQLSVKEMKKNLQEKYNQSTKLKK